MRLEEVFTCDFEEFREACRADYQNLRATVSLDTTPEVERMLLLHSIHGHARNAHAEFRKTQKKFVNATTEDIYLALGLSVDELHDGHQKVIDDIVDWVRTKLMPGRTPITFTNADGEPLGGIRALLDYILETEAHVQDVLRGIHLGGIMDNYAWRKKVQDKYDISMGGGETFAVDFIRLLEQGRNVHMAFMSELGWFADGDPWMLDAWKHMGIILDVPEVEASERFRSGYVRYELGQGVSDDGAHIAAGLLYSPWAAMGLQLADCIDTFDKGARRIVLGGQDEAVSTEVARNARLNLSEEEKLMFIRIAALAPRIKSVADCSQRYFHQKHSPADTTAFRTYLMAIDSMRRQLYNGANSSNGKFKLKDIPRLHVGGERKSNLEVLDYFNRGWVQKILEPSYV